MANKTTTQQEAVKELVVDARFVMRSFEQDGKEQEFLSFELIDPFNDEDFRNIALKAKWDKYDEKNRLVRPDRVFSCMKFYAKKALRTSDEIPVKVTIKPVTYKNKKTSKMVTYAAMFAEPTFVELEDERPVEIVIKGADNNNIFSLLAGKALGIAVSSKDDDDYEDIA